MKNSAAIAICVISTLLCTAAPARPGGGERQSATGGAAGGRQGGSVQGQSPSRQPSAALQTPSRQGQAPSADGRTGAGQKPGGASSGRTAPAGAPAHKRGTGSVSAGAAAGVGAAAFSGDTRPQTPGSGSPMSAQQQTNVEQLKSDLTSIKQGSQVTQEQKNSLQSRLTAMSDGATKPDPALVQTLSSDLSQAMADGNLSPQEKARLSADVQKVLNSANIPASEVQAAIADAQAILTASGVDQQDVQKVVTDLQAIAAEAQNNAPQTNSTQNNSGAKRGRR